MRLLLVEDERWVRDGVVQAVRALDPAVAVTACADARSATAALAASTFDTALVDLGLPDASGIDVIVAIRRRQPACSPVAFTKFDDAPTILTALRAGARGYLLKTIASDRILPSLREAKSGGLPLSPAVARLVVDTLLTAPDPDDAVRLTARESELLALLARGASYAQCAEQLGIGLGTVQTYVKSIYVKLDVSSKVEATRVALRLGLVR